MSDPNLSSFIWSITGLLGDYKQSYYAILRRLNCVLEPSNAECAVALLKDHRTALISAAVPGQIEVRKI